MTRLADGQLDITVPGIHRQDEIGAMAYGRSRNLRPLEHPDQDSGSWT
jgi:hypothetical protein